MKHYPTSTEVDYIVIGSGAAGGIMAKQLSVAGFSVVVLEQGSWGKYGREHEYNKDEWLQRNLSDEDRLMSDPAQQRNTFRPNDKVKAVPGTHAYGCVVGGGGRYLILNLPKLRKLAIFDVTETVVIEKRFVRVMAWYDNEWGFSNRMVDAALAFGKLG